MTDSALNSDQQQAAQDVFQFLLSDDKEFRISGPGGTGKTFLMKHIMKTVLQEYEDACKLLGIPKRDYEIALTATTNQATEVLSEATGFPAQTIHSFLNLKVQDDYKTGESKAVRTDRWMVHRKKLVFIDEASMVSATLYKFIQEGFDSTCKVIYLGDRCQLAPVREKLSQVYRTKGNTAELLIPVRNAGQPALVELCRIMRENVDTLQFPRIQEVPGVIDYLDGPAAKAFIDSTFCFENPKARVLCYSNSKVVEYNQYTRNLRGYPSTFTQGETVVVTSAFAIGKNFLKAQQELIVKEIIREPYVEVLYDGEAEINLYEIKLQTSVGEVFQVKIPVNPDHFRELKNYYARRKEWRKMYRLKDSYPDLRPRDASTVYKAQGSTYETVFLDLENIGKCTDYSQAARMLYVGVSRPTTRLCLYGQLPARFFEPRTALETA